MKKTRAKTEYRIGTGASSLLLIFVVLSLTALGILTYSGANADLRLTERSVRMAEDYYQAADRAQRALAALDGMMAEHGAEEGIALFESAAAEDLADWGIERPAENRLLMRFDAKSDRVLELEIEFAQESVSGARWKILRHQLVDTQLWEPTTDYGLFSGE